MGFTGSHTSETKDKIAATLRGRPLSSERRLKISEARKGKPLSEAHKIALRGKRHPTDPKSEETKRRLSEARLAYFRRIKDQACLN